MIFHGHAENDKALFHCLKETETIQTPFSHTQNMFRVRVCKNVSFLYRELSLFSRDQGWLGLLDTV